jgi:beta-glucosidase
MRMTARTLWAHRIGIVLFALVLLGLLLVVFETDIFDSKPIAAMPPQDALYLDKSQPLEKRVADLLSYMTLEEKIGQMALVEKGSVKDLRDIATYHLGALLSGAGSKPETNTAQGWKQMIAEYQAVAKTSRLGIPLLYGADAVHGHAHVPGVTVFPHEIGLGAANNPELVKAISRATAEDLRATGVNWSFSPNLDQPRDIRWGRVYEAFSDDQAIVSKLGVASLEGLQSKDSFVLATPKHFLGLGSMEWSSSLNKNFNIDQGVTPADETLMRQQYLPPFVDVVKAGALSIMVGLNTWGDKRMVLQKHLLTDVLKGELGFKGFTVSDWYGVHEGRQNTFLATVQAVNAGVDMAMLPFDYKAFVRDVKWANRLHLISDERINEAAGRILYAKFATGLFDAPGDVAILPISHRELARDAVAQSLVLLKNTNAVLPLSPQVQHIRVAGSAADNVGRQMGAWSIEWQGIDGNTAVGATSILAGIKNRAGDGVQVEYDRLGMFVSGPKASVGIAIVGEKPYAEGWGDEAYPHLDADDLHTIKNLQASCDRVIVVIVSGRPLLIENEVGSFDALVAAWLPGSEGEGVADVLFGDKPFTGTLPLPWPLRSEQLPITMEGKTADNTPVLFPRGFGLKK